MRLPASPGYALIDPRPVASGAPYTYFVPSDAELRAATVGDLVKLVFEHVPEGQDWDTERMWVAITEDRGRTLVGNLVNTPREPTATIRHGDTCLFPRCYIIDIQFTRPEARPVAPQRRSYWERCLVDRCVLDGDQPVEYLYREEPEPNESDTYPDSGWRIRGRAGDATGAEMDEREVQFVALGAVLNRDDSWLHLIDEPIGSAFMRNCDTEEYEACAPDD